MPLAYASSDNDDDDEDEKRYDKKGKYINNWDGSKLTYDEMVERNQKCLEMERKGYLLNVNCTSFLLTQEGEKIIVDYIVQMAIKGYYQPKNSDLFLFVRSIRTNIFLFCKYFPILIY
jgi:hypothetical protein